MSLQIDQMKQIVEAAILVADHPLSVEQLIRLFDEAPEIPSAKMMQQILKLLEDDYRERGIQLVEVASGFRFQARADLARWLQKLYYERPVRYSRAFLETLALVAYRQPITRAEIEDIRGVSVSSSIIKTLMERDWIKVVGQKDVPGKPALYATTKQFLDDFNLTSLNQLPELSELKDLEGLEEKLGEQLKLQVNTVKNNSVVNEE